MLIFVGNAKTNRNEYYRKLLPKRNRNAFSR